MEHLQIGNVEFLLSSSDHFSEIEIGVGFEHAVCPCIGGMVLIGGVFSHQFFSRELVSVADYLELAVEAQHHVADEQVVQLDLRVLYLFEEDFVVFEIVLNNMWVTISICWAGTK